MATKKTIEDYSSPEMDAHTLMQAHKIKQDPKRHAAAQAHAKSRLEAMRAVAESAEATPDAESPAEDKAEVAAVKRRK